MAIDYKGIATGLRGYANQLDPPAPSGSGTTGSSGTPTTGGGGTVITPDFPGRWNVDTNVWKAPSFEENFPNLAAEGKFLTTYSKWDAYPTDYHTTDGKGFYDPGKISVIDAGGSRVMQCRLVPASHSSDGKRPSGCAPQPRFGTQGDGRTKGEFIQARIKVAKAVKGYHAANLGWPLNDNDWPRLGEDDFFETDLGPGCKVGAYLHVQNGGSNGEGQVSFNSGVSAEDWFVIGRERIAGKYYKWYVNGKQVGDTVTNNVPNDYWRWVLQNETSGTSQTDECLVWYDWITIWEPK